MEVDIYEMERKDLVIRPAHNINTTFDFCQFSFFTVSAQGTRYLFGFFADEIDVIVLEWSYFFNFYLSVTPLVIFQMLRVVQSDDEDMENQLGNIGDDFHESLTLHLFIKSYLSTKINFA